MTDRIVTFTLFAIIAAMFAALMAFALDNVGRVQLDIVYACNVQYTAPERAAYCRRELDGFGYLVDLSSSRYGKYALNIE